MGDGDPGLDCLLGGDSGLGVWPVALGVALRVTGSVCGRCCRWCFFVVTVVVLVVAVVVIGVGCR